MTTLLIVDDDATFLRIAQRSLEPHGFEVTTAADAASARACISRQGFDAALLDLSLEGHSGLSLIAPLRAASPGARIIMLTGYASITSAVDAIKLGADDYLTKPAGLDTLLKSLAGARSIDPEATPATEPMSVDRLEWEHIQRVLNENEGNISATARALKMHRRTLQRKLAKRPARA